MNEEEIRKQNMKWILLGLCLIAFFALSLIISFNNGFKQGVEQVLNCEKNNNTFVIEKHSFTYECKNNNFNKQVNQMNNYNFNFSEVKSP